MSTKSQTPPPAYFLSLSLENVRSFGKKQTISFARKDGRPAQWTIILGDNGVGKTTVLKALAAIIPFDADEKRGLGIMFARKWRFVWSVIRHQGKEAAKITGGISTGSELLKNNSKPTKRSLSDVIEMIVPARKTYLDVDAVGWPQISKNLSQLVCYAYGAGRTIGSSTLSEVSSSEDACLSLFHDKADLLNPEEWFLQADYRVKSDDNRLTKQNFELLRQALITVLDKVTDIKVAPVASGGNPEQGLQFKTPYGWVRLRNLSLGYQTLAVWLTDFASKLFIRYPDSPNPLEEPAIVLIDEIDLHLHPAWQRKLIGFLSNIFINTQFIATAHSPLVVQAAGDERANVVLLKREGDQTIVYQNLQDVSNWRIDQILSSELFEYTSSLSVLTEEELALRNKLLLKKSLTAKEKARLVELNEQVAAQPIGDTPAERKVESLLARLAQNLKPGDLLE